MVKEQLIGCNAKYPKWIRSCLPNVKEGTTLSGQLHYLIYSLRENNAREQIQHKPVRWRSSCRQIKCFFCTECWHRGCRVCYWSISIQSKRVVHWGKKLSELRHEVFVWSNPEFHERKHKLYPSGIENIGCGNAKTSFVLNIYKSRITTHHLPNSTTAV